MGSGIRRVQQRGRGGRQKAKLTLVSVLSCEFARMKFQIRQIGRAVLLSTVLETILRWCGDRGHQVEATLGALEEFPITTTTATNEHAAGWGQKRIEDIPGHGL